jgi:hypothetical protein
LSAAVGLVFSLAFSLPAAAETDFLKAPKVACAPDRMTRCKSPGSECETREASEGDKKQLLVIDFTAKKAVMRRERGERPYGDVGEEKVEGDTRVIVLVRERGERKTSLTFRLKGNGKMESTQNEGRVKLEISCVAE